MARDFAKDFNSAANDRPSTDIGEQNRYQICIQELTNDPAGNGTYLLEWLEKARRGETSMTATQAFLETVHSSDATKAAFVEALAHTRGVYDTCLQQFPVPDGVFLFDRSRDWKQNYHIVTSKISELQQPRQIPPSPGAFHVQGPRTLQ